MAGQTDLSPLMSQLRNYLPLAGGTMTGDITIGAHSVKTTNMSLKEGESNVLYVWNHTASYYGHTIAYNIKPAGEIIFLSDGQQISAPYGDDNYVSLAARRNSNGQVAVARLQGAAEPRLLHILPLNIGAFTELTIATGAVTAGVASGAASYTLDTEGDNATDDLDTINGGREGDIIVLRAEDSARTVVAKHNTGNIQLNGQADFSLDNIYDTITLIYDGSNWLEIARSSNGV